MSGTTGSLEAGDLAAAAVQKTPYRVTLELLKSKVDTVDYVRSGVMTIAIMTLRNGYVLIGKSAPADAGNYDQQLGRQFAYEDALRQLWPLEGYLLREQLFLHHGGSKNAAPIGVPETLRRHGAVPEEISALLTETTGPQTGAHVVANDGSHWRFTGTGFVEIDR